MRFLINDLKKITDVLLKMKRLLCKIYFITNCERNKEEEIR